MIIRYPACLFRARIFYLISIKHANFVYISILLLLYEDMGKQLAYEMGSRTYLSLGLESCNKAISGPPKIFTVLSFVLEKSIQKNEKLLKSSKSKNMPTIFHSSIAPGVSIRQYIERIFKYSNCSTSCLVVAYIYMEKFLQQVGDCLTSLNVHRLLITSIVLAAKYVEDE